MESGLQRFPVQSLTRTHPNDIGDVVALLSVLQNEMIGAVGSSRSSRASFCLLRTDQGPGRMTGSTPAALPYFARGLVQPPVEKKHYFQIGQTCDPNASNHVLDKPIVPCRFRVLMASGSAIPVRAKRRDIPPTDDIGDVVPLMSGSRSVYCDLGASHCQSTPPSSGDVVAPAVLPQPRSGPSRQLAGQPAVPLMVQLAAAMYQPWHISKKMGRVGAELCG